MGLTTATAAVPMGPGQPGQRNGPLAFVWWCVINVVWKETDEQEKEIGPCLLFVFSEYEITGIQMELRRQWTVGRPSLEISERMGDSQCAAGDGGDGVWTGMMMGCGLGCPELNTLTILGIYLWLFGCLSVSL